MHAHASDLANDSFIRQVLDRQHFEPDGKYHLFGSRGELAERSGHIGLGNIQSHQLGNLMIQQAAIKGNIGYIVRFSDHGHEVHSPFDNHASHSDSDEAGSPVDGFSLYRIHWDGYEHHPADGYDGPQGGGYPAPKGARDIYSYDIKGVAQNIRLNLTDNRSTGQRLVDRFHNTGSMLTQGVGDGFKRATRYSPELDRSGNAAEAFNGTADIVKNIIGAAGEIVGAGDAVQGISEGSNIAVMHGLGLLSTENKMARINDLADMAQLKDYAAAAIRDWAVQNPNAAQGIEAVSNIFTAVIPVKGIGAVRGKYGLGGITAHPVKRSQMGAIALPKGKSAVSDNFADAAYAKYPSPYHSRNIRSNLEQRYGKENITSSTVPPSNGKNVKLADQRHPKTGVPFDGKGFPNFEKDVKYDTRINTAVPQVNPIDEPVFNPKGSVGSAHSWSITARIQYAKLPRQGRIRYIPPKNYSPSAPLPKGPNNGYSAGNLSKKVLTLVYINGKLKFGPSSLPSSALKAPVPIVGKAEAPPGKAVPVGEARIPSNPKAVKGTTVTLSQEQRLANGELIPKGSVVTWSDNAVKVVRPDGKKRRFNSRDWEQKALPKPQLPKDYRDDINIGGNNPRFNQQRHEKIESHNPNRIEEIRQRNAVSSAERQADALKRMQTSGRTRLPGQPQKGKPGAAREMSSSDNPNQTAEAFARRYLGRKPTLMERVEGEKLYGGKCVGCWKAQMPDGTFVVYRPAGNASMTKGTTASVDINNPTLNNLNINLKGKPTELKFKFPAR